MACGVTQRVSSIKTRIKTGIENKEMYDFLLREYLPLKQGLRPFEIKERKPGLPQRVSSIKTRIKTY